MENKLVIWAVNAEDKESFVKSIKGHLNVEYLIKERELTETENGFRFLFDDEAGSEIEISLSQQQDNLFVSVAGNCSWDVLRINDEWANGFRGGAYTEGSTFDNQAGGKRKTRGNFKIPAGWDTEPGSHGTIHRTGRSRANSFARAVNESPKPGEVQ
ncbi:hypothetical protein FB479_102375 [Brevibacillus sp. AG162]|uniref:hypothetical protein n=1 Tax=Brevibacillus sp. AG162 TaxID=2572910 RepID=UPI00114FB77B|nr:hypothetical protein [Brevibacillus sp. AG162]TQK73741.1 hypothetical protein FB479_102375 [Brevibacillus sp. AG162]